MWQVAAVGNYCVSCGQVTVVLKENGTWKLLTGCPSRLFFSTTIMNSALCLSLDDCVDCRVSSTQRSHIVYRDKNHKDPQLTPHCHLPINPINSEDSRKKWTLVCRNESDFWIYIFIIAVSYKSPLSLRSRWEFDYSVSHKIDGDSPLGGFCIEIQNNDNLKRNPSFHQSAILKAHCWDKDMNNVVPYIPLYIKEDNAMQTGWYFCCLIIGI